MSNNLLEMPGRQAQPDRTTPTRVTRAQRAWLRRVLGVKLPRRRRAAVAGGSKSGPITMQEAA
jgi:hypothetical protein